jgi:uncharacterized protein YbaR (Trm112 family)
MDWLRAELSGLEELSRAHPERRREVRTRLLRWRANNDLAGLRDPAALAKLPGKESEACRALWAKVETILLSMAADIHGKTEKRVDRSDSVVNFVREITTQSILSKLREPIPMMFPNETSLEDILRYIRAATSTTNSAGIPLYFDPVGLETADKTMTSPVVLIDLEGVPLRTTLRLLLEQLGLAYQIRDGVLIITSEEAVDATDQEPKTPVRDGRTEAILKKMEAPIPMPFPDGIPLGKIIQRIKQATQGPNDAGLPIYVDPLGLVEAETTESSPVKINVEGVPLKQSLKMVLDQVGLTYTVKDGVIIITSKISKE